MRYAYVYALEDSYLEYLKISLISLKPFISNNDLVILYKNSNFLNDLNNFLDKNNIHATLKMLECNNFKGCNKNYNPALKLEIFKLNEYKKIIFLDCDTVVCKDLTHLFKSNINFGACLYKDRKDYFNSGVMVIGEDFLNKDFFSKICNMWNSGTFKMNEELLNIIFSEKLNILNENYNTLACSSSIENAYIIHFASYYKLLYNIESLKNLNKILKKNTEENNSRLEFLDFYYRNIDFNLISKLFLILTTLKKSINN